jgi:tripartite-type tricarboxylate transporter receptor subunit TctC
MRALGVQLVHVPYQGMGPAINDLVAGHIQTMFAAVATALPHIEEGRLRAIALTGGERLARLPGIPVMSETIPGFNHVEWFAVVAPPRTPATVVESISEAIAEALRAPDVRERLERASLVTIGNKPAEAAAFIAGEESAGARSSRLGGINRNKSVTHQSERIGHLGATLEPTQSRLSSTRFDISKLPRRWRFRA